MNALLSKNQQVQPAALDAAPVPHVVIIGAGFGGLRAARELRSERVRVTVVDRTNHHLFLPLLYQVATGGMTAEEIAVPVRAVLGKQANTRVLQAAAERVDLATQEVFLHSGEVLHYDRLIVAAGATNNYYDHPEWRAHTHTLGTLQDAYGIRARVLSAFEAAERCTDEATQRRLLTFVAVGGGPTGAELAGALAELSQAILRTDFHRVNPAHVRVVLVEMMPSILAPFGAALSEKATQVLTRKGVQVRAGVQVQAIGEDCIRLDGEDLPCSLVCWTAGVKPRPLAERLGVPLDKRGFVRVDKDCSIPGHRNAYVIGDMAAFYPPGADKPLPGLAPVAMQQASCVARNILRQLDGKSAKPFAYVDKGIMAILGGGQGLVRAGNIQLSGFIAWLAWIFVHVYYLIGFRSRSLVLFEWFWAYTTHRRGARVLAEAVPEANVHLPQFARPDKEPEAAEAAARPELAEPLTLH